MRRQMDDHMREAMQQVQSGGGGGMVVSIPADLNQEVSPIAVEEKDDRYVCTLGIQGVDEDSIEVTVQGIALTISGKRTSESTQEREGRIIAHMRQTEHFSRSTALPGPVKDSCMRTTFKDGVLTVDLPKGVQAPEPLPLP
jgi:HSP20 family protein